jgi:hypothetical protein
MKKIKSISAVLCFILLFVVLIFGSVKLGKYMNYKLYYQSYIQKELLPLQKRMDVLENRLNSLTNGPVQLP